MAKPIVNTPAINVMKRISFISPEFCTFFDRLDLNEGDSLLFVLWEM